jgi:hypothetical protein
MVTRRVVPVKVRSSVVGWPVVVTKNMRGERWRPVKAPVGPAYR